MNHDTTKNSKTCFVCNKEINDEKLNYNIEVNLPVCASCHGTDEESKAVKNALDSLGEGFVCGCI